MKNLKKITALFVVFAMIMSLCVVNVFAANDITIDVEAESNQIAQGGSTVVNIYATYAENLTMQTPAIWFTYDKDNFTVAVNTETDEETLYVYDEDPFTTEVGFDASAGLLLLNTTATKKLIANEKTLLASFIFTAGANAAAKSYSLVLDEVNTSVGSVSLTVANHAISIAESAVINSVEAVAAVTDKNVGTAATELGLPETLEVATASKESAVGAELKVTWNTANYDPLVLTEQTITGEVKIENEFWMLADGFVNPTVKVTLNPITADYTTDAVTDDIKAVKVALEGADLDAYVKEELPATVAIKKGDVEDTVAVTWGTVTPSESFAGATVVGENATVEGTLGASTKGLFNVGGDTITATVTVVAAEIEGGAIEIESVSINKAPVVTVTIPASEFVADGTETVEKQVQAKDENGELVWEKNEDGSDKVDEEGNKIPVMETVTETVTVPNNEVVVTIGEETETVMVGEDDVEKDKKGTEDVADDTVVITVEFAKKLSELGVANGETVSISATVNGAAVIVGEEQAKDEQGNPVWEKNEDGSDKVDEEGNKIPVMAPVTNIAITAKKPITGGNGGGIPTRPSTDKPGTETPGTTPGTETPGTTTEPDQVPQTEGPFADVAADHWAAAPIAQLKEAGVVNGSGDGNYTPEADITRAEFTKMVVGVMGLEAAAAEVAFEDCTAEDWFTPYVAAAVEAGLVNGVSETEFAPNATITREQAFAIIGRAIDAEATTAVAFTDAADIDEYAAPYVALLVELGIVNGYEDNTIRPDANITRAEAAKILAGFMDKLKADAEVLPETEEVVEEVVEEEATEEVVEEEATEEVVDEK